jgi:hypothetical protein
MRVKLVWTSMVLAVLAQPAVAQVGNSAGPVVPSPQTAITRACDAAGGLSAFSRLHALRIDVNREEITQDGKQSSGSSRLFVLPPGPLPGRLEIQSAGVIAGDDGEGGWALQNGKPDSRPANFFMIKRLLQTDLFPMLLPFSLTWPEVAVTEVAPAQLGERPVWRLTTVLQAGFFHTPQIANTWTVYLDRESYEVVQAESPYVDLGKDVVADGMRYRFARKTDLGGVALWSELSIVGLDAYNKEKVHTRLDRLTITAMDPGAAPAMLFANPIPSEQRPKMEPNVRLQQRPPGAAPRT